VLNWVEIDARAIRWNLGQFRSRLEPSTKLGAVVKSNAYGHGMDAVAAIAEDAGADWLCANNIDEAVRLREGGRRARILVMGYIPLGGLAAVIEHDLQPVVCNLPTLARLDELASAAGRRVPLHLKIETGTHRQGIPEAEIGEFARRIEGSNGLRLEGLSTHFANIEDTTDHRFAQSQLDAFTRIDRALRERGLTAPLHHSACSAAALLFTRTHMDLARIGIALYGLWPSKETYVACLKRGKPTLELLPALTWKPREKPLGDRPRLDPRSPRSVARTHLHEHVHGRCDRHRGRAARG